MRWSQHVISECCLRHRILWLASRTTLRQLPRLLRRCGIFCVGVESVNHQSASSEGRQDWCHLGPSQVRSVDVRTAATVLPSVGLWGDFALFGLWSSILAVTDVQEAVSQSNEFLCWRQHSLITRCGKCTNLQGDYVEIGSLFSRIEKNAVLDKTRQNKQTFSLSVRLSYVAILSSFGARKKKKASVVRRVRVTIVAVEKQYVLHNVSTGLVIKHAMRMCHIVICGLSGSTIFFHIIS